MSVSHAILAVVALQRGAELVFAAVNTRRLRAQGGYEVDAHGYPWIVGLHAAWLAALAASTPANEAPIWPLLGVYAALQAIRVWVIATLGRRWTTRIIVLPGAPLIRRGPYRWLRHPNYAVVSAEIAVLPLAFGAPLIALVFAAASLVLIDRRIAIEDGALRGRTDPARCALDLRTAGKS